MPEPHGHRPSPDGPECIACIQGWVTRVEEYRTARDEAAALLKRWLVRGTVPQDPINDDTRAWLNAHYLGGDDGEVEGEGHTHPAVQA